MHVGALERRGIDAQARGARLDQGERGLGALLHHVAELAGQNQLSAARILARLDEQDVSAHRGPGEPGRHARHSGAQRDFVLELGRAEDVGEIALVDARLSLSSPSAIFTAMRRHTAPIWRSSERTPASRV